MTPPKRLHADDKPEPPRDPAVFSLVAWDSYGRATTRIARGHRAWRVGRVWWTLCGLYSGDAESVIDGWPVCAKCAKRLQKIREKHDEDHTSPPATGV